MDDKNVKIHSQFRVRTRKYRKNITPPNVLKLAVAEVWQFPQSEYVINFNTVFNYLFVKNSTGCAFSI